MNSLGYKNIHLKLSALGDVEMKYVSGGDIHSYHSLNNETDDKIFSLKILYHQILKPDVSFGDFADKVTDTDIQELITAYLKLNSGIFKTEIPEGNLVNWFASGIRKYLKGDLERAERMLKPFKDSAAASMKQLSETLQRISKNFPSIPSIEQQSVLSEPIRITSPEEYAWERHSQAMDVLQKTVSIQEEILNEQKSSSSVAKAALFVARFTLAVAAATLIVTLLL